MFVTVYGTLKRGHGNHRCLKDATFVAECMVHEFKLYNSGFPVAAHSEGDSIVGEIFDIGDPSECETALRTLAGLDALEGYREWDEANSMYIRKVINAYADDGEIYDSHMYVGNDAYWSGYRMMKECPNDYGVYTWG